MNWLLEPFHHEFMQRALLGCALIGFTNGYLSAFIVLRRLALMADALSHSLLPGLAFRVRLVLLLGLIALVARPMGPGPPRCPPHPSGPPAPVPR